MPTRAGRLIQGTARRFRFSTSQQTRMQALRGTPLKRFHRAFRRAHPIEHNIKVILQNVEYPTNVGSIFRIADATRVEELILAGITPTPPNPTITKVGRNKHTRVPWHHVESLDQTIANLKDDGYRIYALEITKEAKPYHEMEWPVRLGLVLGHEEHGITRSTLSWCDEAIFVPMWGKGASLNVHVALAVVIYQIRCQAITD